MQIRREIAHPRCHLLGGLSGSSFACQGKREVSIGVGTHEHPPRVVVVAFVDVTMSLVELALRELEMNGGIRNAVGPEISGAPDRGFG